MVNGQWSFQSQVTGRVLDVRELNAAVSIQFHTGSVRGPILELKLNGDILVKGRLIENDKEVVDGMRELLGLNKKDKE
ncbi:hypothetical protein SAMN04487767_101519 [Bacillus wiedmannii]|uniref:Uncharacterized protein n=1 Tax=Bacillus wiedmannii TaxID=1890302 RepID=A0A1G6JV11_9BACI|nr:hypothetical protein [Bacillus wiedmannii]SDC22461.1 hypothetical protein SAMN04487767_101519 [Bacillus wiedmannii]